ncbi:MAG: hypothetical protein KF791_03470 [Verrucomicrobiae bacterium]|nr:hypothetical protein [Verrucomicrobiae bacterium]
MHRPLRPLTLLLAAAAGATATAQETPYDLEKTGWYVRAGAFYQFGLSVSVNATAPPPSPQRGIYDNGYVLPDINNGADDLTWNWGYQDAGQLVDGSIEMSRILGRQPVTGLDGFGDANLFGPEILVGFEFYRFDLGKRTGLFGFELGFRYASYSGNDRTSVESQVLQERNRYDLGGVVAPLAPYSGSANVAGPLISLTPVPQAPISSAATSTLSTDLSADFYTARFGAWLLVPITEKFSTAASAGFTSIYAYGNAEFAQSQDYASPLIPSVTESLGQNKGDWLPGAYMQVRATYWFREWIGAYGSVEWAWNGALRIQGLGYEAVFDFGSTFAVSGGVQVSF